MKRGMLSFFCTLAGLTVGVAFATDVPRVAAPKPMIVPEYVSASPAEAAPAPASEKVKQAYAEQKIARAQGKRAGAKAKGKQLKKGKPASVAKAKHKKPAKMKRKNRAA